MPPAKIKYYTFLERDLSDRLGVLKKRYENCAGIKLNDSQWIALCLEKGLPIMVAFIQGLEEARNR